ncbi:hypothetical protein HPB48_001295 [Haemaphysalis longicornis]|uniref:Uncharacterized protein n=1 Tax=Haemaphysalis longicornis TaxID=44386 RepID=A0A9J6GQN5_HAELO|nr:hypothetical protein HPB48_001295 [Haemaphysalis longicornis]
MLYGRDPVGPLAILKSSWAGETEMPAELAEAPADYLRQLKEQIELAADVSELNASKKQEFSSRGPVTAEFARAQNEELRLTLERSAIKRLRSTPTRGQQAVHAD